MRDFFESIFRFGWAMSTMALKQFANIFAPEFTRPAPSSAPPALPAAPPAGVSGSSSAPPMPVPPINVNSGSLNTAKLVVLGEGLAAGVGDFSLYDDGQIWSFPAQMARQMNAGFSQRLIQPPGIGNFVGFAPLSVRVAAPMQTTVLEQLPPLPVANLSVPEFRLSDALDLHPQ